MRHASLSSPPWKRKGPIVAAAAAHTHTSCASQSDSVAVQLPDKHGGSRQQAQNPEQFRLPFAGTAGDPSMPRWFCGREPAWQFFSAPLLETKCYFTSTISREALEGAGLTVWESEPECGCTPAPPPPAPPPQTIYFCGRPGDVATAREGWLFTGPLGKLTLPCPPPPPRRGVALFRLSNLAHRVLLLQHHPAAGRDAPGCECIFG